jgi:hypothetical protein
MKKTLLTLLIAAPLFLGAISEKKEKKYDSIKDVISHKIHYPKIDTNVNPIEKVYVKYTVSNDGTMTIYDTFGSNKYFETYVFDRLDGTKVTVDTANCERIMVIKFKLVE